MVQQKVVKYSLTFTIAAKQFFSVHLDFCGMNMTSPVHVIWRSKNSFLAGKFKMGGLLMKDKLFSFDTVGYLLECHVLFILTLK